MRNLCLLAAASLLSMGLSSAAFAAPVAVTYGFGPGGSATWTPGFGTAGSGNAGGQMVVVYTSGSTVVGGTLGTLGSIQVLQLGLAAPAFIGTLSVPGMLVGGGALGARTAGGVGNFGGATYFSASAVGPGAPPFPVNGNAAIAFNPLGAITIALTGSGNQVIGVPAAWTIGQGSLGPIIGQEISRASVPEAGTGLLLLAGLASVAYGARRVRRR